MEVSNMISLVILGLMALTGAGVAWAASEDNHNEEIGYHDSYPDQSNPLVDITKRTDYDEVSRTLTETVTTTKVYPDVELYHLIEEDM
jgi:hypothetical protein